MGPAAGVVSHESPAKPSNTPPPMRSLTMVNLNVHSCRMGLHRYQIVSFLWG